MDNINKYDYSTANNVVTLSDVQTYLNTNDNSITGSLNDIIFQVSAEFESYCGTGLSANNYSGSYDGTGYDKLYLNNTPIISVSKIQYIDKTNNITTDITDYYVSNQYIGLYNNIFTIGNKNIYIEYRAGYETVPYDIQRVALEKVAEVYKRSFRKNADGSLLKKTENETSGGSNFSTTYEDIDLRVYKVLDKYKKIGL